MTPEDPLIKGVQLQSESDESVLQQQCIRFLGMDLTPGTKRRNVIATFVLYFGLYLYLFTKTGTLSYLVIADYGVEQDNSGKVVGKLNSYATICLAFC